MIAEEVITLRMGLTPALVNRGCGQFISILKNGHQADLQDYVG